MYRIKISDKFNGEIFFINKSFMFLDEAKEYIESSLKEEYFPDEIEIVEE